MAVPKAVIAMEGSWKGSSKLNLPEDPAVDNVFESGSTLQVESDPLRAFARVAYTWEHDGQWHQGVLLVCGSEASDTVTGAWADSWHQNSSVLQVAGTGIAGDRVSLTGAYSVEGYSDWGWRIDLGLAGEVLELRMTNISPEGDEYWAVQADYERA